MDAVKRHHGGSIPKSSEFEELLRLRVSIDVGVVNRDEILEEGVAKIFCVVLCFGCRKMRVYGISDI